MTVLAHYRVCRDAYPEVQKVVDPASLARGKYLAWQKVFEENQAINVDYHIKHIL